jgi:hypothetical protein
MNTTNTEVTWSDVLGHRSRKAFSFVIKDGKISEFQGSSIPGVIAVVGKDFRKNGKWSHSTYQLVLAAGVCFVAGHMGWETGYLEEGLSSATSTKVRRWMDVANVLNIDLVECFRFFRDYAPNMSVRLDKVEADLLSLLDAS